MRSPFIFKIKFYSPDVVDDVENKNAAHIGYIGTRPGVDKGELEVGDNDISNESNISDSEIHVKYMGERPKSHGLFNEKQGEVPDLFKVQQELRQHKGIVWRAIISLKEEEAERLGYNDKKDWERVIREYMPEAAKEMGIKQSNLRYVGAFHQEQGHPHCHLVFWEREPLKEKGKIRKDEIKQVKKVLRNGFYEEERKRLYQEKNMLRDYIKNNSVKGIKQIKDLVKEVRQEKADEEKAPKLHKEEQKELKEKLESLAQKMPVKGRTQLKYMPKEVKDEAREVSEWLLKQPEFLKSYYNYQNKVKEITSHNVKDENSLQKAQENAHNDIRDRVAQTVVKGAAEVNKYYKQISNNIKNNAFEIIKDTSDYIQSISKSKRNVNIDQYIIEKMDQYSDVQNKKNRDNYLINKLENLSQKIPSKGKVKNFNFNSMPEEVKKECADIAQYVIEQQRDNNDFKKDSTQQEQDNKEQKELKENEKRDKKLEKEVSKIVMKGAGYINRTEKYLDFKERKKEYESKKTWNSAWYAIKKADKELDIETEKLKLNIFKKQLKTKYQAIIFDANDMELTRW